MDLVNALRWHGIQPQTQIELKHAIVAHYSANYSEKRTVQPRSPKTRVRIYFLLSLGVAISSVLFYAITTGFTTDPCDDFYEFSCQEWHARNPRPEWALEWGTFDVISNQTNILVSEILERPIEDHDLTALKQAKDFYQKCLIIDNEQSSELDFVWKTLETYGGWPILYENGTWNSNKFDLMKSVAALQNRFNFPILFKISSVQFSPIDPADNFIFISKPESNIFMPREFVSDLIITWFVHFFRSNGNELSDLILSVRNELSYFKQINNATKLVLWSQIKDIMNNTITFMTPTKTERSRDVRTMFGFYKNSDQMNIKTLQAMVDFFVGAGNKVDFKSLLEYVYEDVGVEIDDSVNLFVPDIEYVLDTSLQLHQLSDESIANFLHFVMTYEMASLDTGNLRRFYEAWWNALHYTERSRPPKLRECSEETQDKFKFVVTHELVKQKYNDMDQFRDVRNEVQTIFDNVKSSMLKHSVILGGRPWPVKACIGFPDWIFDRTAVQNEYFGLQLYTNHSFLEQKLIVNTWTANNALRDLKYRLDNKCAWKRFPGGVGAFLRVDQLMIYLPLGALQPPIFDINRSTPSNYGSLGALIGHELAHAFSKSEWLTYRDRPISSFENCLKRQYNSFVEDEPKVTTNGDQTVAENVADNIGFREAYSAVFESTHNNYQRNKLYLHDNEQIKLKTERSFFLSFAQMWCVSYIPEGLQEKIEQGPHSPGMFRVLGTLQNSKQFKKAWICKVGSKMSPLKRGHQNCEIS